MHTFVFPRFVRGQRCCDIVSYAVRLSTAVELNQKEPTYRRVMGRRVLVARVSGKNSEVFIDR